MVIDEARGKIPVIAGTGSNNTEEALKLTKHAKEAGADGALVITPYYNKPTQRGMYLHFEKIAREELGMVKKGEIVYEIISSEEHESTRTIKRNER